jgi:hypothetical protein
LGCCTHPVAYAMLALIARLLLIFEKETGVLVVATR